MAALPPVIGGTPENRLPAVLRAVSARIRGRLVKDGVGWIHDTINPLWNMTARQAQMIYDFARSGNYAQLTYLYNEIENSSPVFNVCVTRRCSAVAELDWQVVESDQRLERNRDKGLVKEQCEYLETAMARIDNLPEALEHFALAAFRGFALTSVWRGSDGMPSHLECLDQWNCCLDKRNMKWLWNPGAVSFMNPTLGRSGLEEIPADASVAVVRKRQIDWPAMKIFLRESIGERDWGRFLETYGLPPVIITMPEFTSKEDEDAYVEAAAGVFEGRSGVVPNGSEVNFASESRGTNPFTEFIEHQMKLFVLLATGGTLTSLSEAQGIGSGASDAQMDVWKQIVRADVRVISNAINKQLCERMIRGCKDFRGRPVYAEFKLNPEPPMTADQMLELAGKAASAGLEIDIGEIQQVCGFTIRKKQEGGMGFNSVQTSQSSMAAPGVAYVADAPVPGETSGGCRQRLDGDGEVARTDAPETAVNAPETPRVASVNTDGAVARAVRTNAAEGDGDGVSAKAEAIGERLVRSLQHDYKAVADEIAKILSMPEDRWAGAATTLIGQMDKLVPDDPAMAEVIEEQMREAFSQQMRQEPDGGEPARSRAIPN